MMTIACSAPPKRPFGPSRQPVARSAMKSVRRHFVEDKRSILLSLRERVTKDLDQAVEWIDDMLDVEDERLPQVEDDVVVVKDPEVIVKDSEGYD